MAFTEEYRPDRDPRIDPIPGDILKKEEVLRVNPSKRKKRTRIVVAVEPGMVCFRRSSTPGTRERYLGAVRGTWIPLEDWRKWARVAEIYSKGVPAGGLGPP